MVILSAVFKHCILNITVDEFFFFLKGLIYFKKRQLCQHCFCLPSEKVHLKRKEFSPFWSKFFPCKVDPFSVGA